MDKTADLHIHTYFSDGTFSPQNVIQLAKNLNLACISICDHDCIDALETAVYYAEKENIELVPGVELTVIKDKREFHILGYFIQWESEKLRGILKRVQKERVQRIKRMIKKLRDFNINVDEKAVLKTAGPGSVGRLHLARAMVAIGAVNNIHDAFNRFIGDFKPCYEIDVGFTPEEAIELILEMNGIPVLAHPISIGETEFLEFIKIGIKGVELFHPDLPDNIFEKYTEFIKEYNLLITGGSDCHGLGKDRILMGSVKIPYELVEKLKNYKYGRT